MKEGESEVEGVERGNVKKKGGGGRREVTGWVTEKNECRGDRSLFDAEDKQREIDCTLTHSQRKCVYSSGYSVLVMYQL